MPEDFKNRVRRFVEDAFPRGEGWVIEERALDNEVDLMFMRRSGAIAIARLVGEGSLSADMVRELSDLRDMNQAYLGIVYYSPKVRVQLEAARLSTRLGVRIMLIE